MLKDKHEQLLVTNQDVISTGCCVSCSGEMQVQPLSDDPYLIIDKKIRNGPYLVRYLIEAESKTASGRLYFCYKDFPEFNEIDSIWLPLVKNVDIGVMWLILYAEEDCFLRFDPVDINCRFNIKTFSIISCSFSFAKKLANIRCPGFLLETNIKAKDISGQDKVSLFKEYRNHLRQYTAEHISTESLHYQDWISKESILNNINPSLLKRHLASLSHKPLISIILPVFNTPSQFLDDCIQSVLSQSYQDWELCISDDNSTDKSVKQIVGKYTKQDPRIHAVFRDSNGHIAANTNSALAIATGEFFIFLDHDDLLTPHSLMYVATAINMQPNSAVFYSDEDKIDINGARSSPHFKSAFNFEMLLSQNYICHLLCVRSDVATAAGGFDLGSEGCQDHIFLIKVAMICAKSRLGITHIPLILYHWRMISGSTALSSSSKDYTSEKFINSFETVRKNWQLSRVKISRSSIPNLYQTDFALPLSLPLVSIIIPTRNALQLTKQCYDSIIASDSQYPNYEIIIVDNQSDDPEVHSWFKSLELHKKTRVIAYDDEFNYSAINNFAVSKAHGEIIVLLNNDTEVISDDWLALLVSHSSRKEVGCVGSMLLYEDGTIQHAGVILGIGGVAGHSHKYFDESSYGYHSRLLITQELSAVTAACLAVKKSIFNQVHGLDEKNLKVAFNDIDFCLKVQAAGYRNIFEPRCKLYHYESKSRGAEDTVEKQQRFAKEVLFMKQKWKKQLANDYFYNPNLTREKEDFSIGEPDFSLEDLNLRTVTGYGL